MVSSMKISWKNEKQNRNINPTTSLSSRAGRSKFDRQAFFCYNLKIFRNGKSDPQNKYHKPKQNMATAGKVEQVKPLAEIAKERREKILEPLNAETRFSPDPDKNIQLLAQAAYADKPEEQQRYAEKIKASLKAHLKDSESMESLWAYLKANYCQTTAILEGILRFFAGEKGEKEIGIAQFMKPIEIKAESNLHETLVEERKTQIQNTRTELSALLAELGQKLPEAPAKTVS
jgi:hypothetical protein